MKGAAGVGPAGPRGPRRGRRTKSRCACQNSVFTFVPFPARALSPESEQFVCERVPQCGRLAAAAGVECLFHCVSELFDIFENFSPVDKAPEVVLVRASKVVLNFVIQFVDGHGYLACLHNIDCGHTEFICFHWVAFFNILLTIY
jgi:hypothetical protein